MDRLLDQLRFHPGTAILAGSILLASLALIALKRTERATLLPRILGLALLAWSVGIAASIRTINGTFHAIALTGSGGYGTVAAGLGESVGAFLLGLLPALLTLAAGLLFGRGAAAAAPRPMGRWLTISLALLSTLVAALSFHALWFVRLVASIALTRPTGAPPSGASVAETAQRVASHVVALSLLSYVAILGSAGLILALFLSGARSLSPGQARWTRALAAVLLVLGLIGTVVAWRQLSTFNEIAMTGMPSLTTDLRLLPTPCDRIEV